MGAVKPVEHIIAYSNAKINCKIETVVEQAREDAKTEVENTIAVPSKSQSKPYEDYRCITDTSSKQYELISRATHNSDGTLTLDGYYLAALGSKYGEVGSKFIFTIGNKEIKIIKADAKQDRHTKNGAGWTGENGHIIELIVDTDYLYSTAKTMGDCNHIENLNGEVTKIKKVK